MSWWSLRWSKDLILTEVSLRGFEIKFSSESPESVLKTLLSRLLSIVLISPFVFVTFAPVAFDIAIASSIGFTLFQLASFGWSLVRARNRFEVILDYLERRWEIRHKDMWGKLTVEFGSFADFEALRMTPVREGARQLTLTWVNSRNPPIHALVWRETGQWIAIHTNAVCDLGEQVVLENEDTKP